MSMSNINTQNLLLIVNRRWGTTCSYWIFNSSNHPHITWSFLMAQCKKTYFVSNGVGSESKDLKNIQIQVVPLTWPLSLTNAKRVERVVYAFVCVCIYETRLRLGKVFFACLVLHAWCGVRATWWHQVHSLFSYQYRPHCRKYMFLCLASTLYSPSTPHQILFSK